MKYLAVSGGMDSMLMLYLYREHSDVKVLHYVYDDPFAQEVLPVVTEYCKFLSIECIVSPVHEKNKYSSNAEADWREGRYKYFDSHLKEGDTLLLAHHKSDQLNSYFSSKMKISYKTLENCYTKEGKNTKRVFIPIYSQRDGCMYKLFRPLSLIYKDKIKQVVEELSIPYLEDPMNSVGQRSRTDKEILPLITSVYPQFKYVFEKDFQDYINKHLDVLPLLSSL